MRPLAIAFVLLCGPGALGAQHADVPRTRTLPGVASSAFPYAQPQELGLSSEKLDRLGDEIMHWVANGDVVGAELLIVKDGRAIFHEAYGWSDRELGIPVERNSIWSIKSMTKPVTATAVLMLAEEGKLSLDDPVTRYIPSFAGDVRTKIRHLLAHTSGGAGGHGGGGYNVYFFDSLRDWVAGWADEEKTGTLGEFAYSNFNYAALGYIVEVVAGEPVETFTERRILAPLGMWETYTAFAPDSAWAARVNSRYRWDSEAARYERYWSNSHLQPWAFYPAAFGLWGTAMDYARFMALWLEKGQYNGVRLLSDETVHDALEPHGFLGQEGLYGYGWFVEAAKARMPLAFRHGGADGTVAVAFPADDAIVIYLAHSEHAGQNAIQNRIGMLDLFDYPGPWMSPADDADVVTPLTQQQRASYVGTYHVSGTADDDPGTVVRVSEQGDRLHVRMGPAGSLADDHFHLVPLGDHRFALGRYDGPRLEAIDRFVAVRFVVDHHEATTLQFSVGGDVEFSADRTDPDSILALAGAQRSRISIAEVMAGALEGNGVDAAWTRYHALRASRPDSVLIAESLMDGLGYRLLQEGRIAEAVVVFEMNAEAYPESPTAHGGLARGYFDAGRLTEARTAYERAVELAEEHEPMHLRTYRARLEEVIRRIEARGNGVSGRSPLVSAPLGRRTHAPRTL